MNGRRFIPLMAAGAVALATPLAAAPAHADWYGTIQGTVLNADGTPARYVDLTATGVDDGNPATRDGSGSGETDRNGVYRISVQRNNTYTIRVNGYSTTAGDSDYLATQQAAGAQGAVTPGPTFTLPAPTAEGAAIPAPTGYQAVLTVAGADPKKIDDVRLFNPATGETYGAERGETTYVYDEATDTGTSTFHPYADGRWYFGAFDAANPPTKPYVPAGNYKIEVSGPDGDIYSGSKTNLRDATVVGVGDKTDLGGLTVPSDQAPGTVTGSIALPRVAGFDEWSSDVTFYPADGGYPSFGSTDSNGTFSVDLSPGTYYASANGGANAVTNFATIAAGTNDYYPDEPPYDTVNPVRFLASYSTATTWYGAKTRAESKAIVVKPGATVSGINFSLANSLKPIENPVIKGKFKKGKKVSVTTGTWNQTDDVVFSYVWKEGSKVVGTSSSLKLSKKVWKKAKKLTVVVTASDKWGSVNTGSVSLKVGKTIKKQVKAAKKQLKKDTKQDNKAIKKASKVG